MDRRELNRVGRCCAKCKTPFMCARAVCPCHGDTSAVCRVPGCLAPLYVAPPSSLSFRDVLTGRKAA